jgi:glycosyltransferase involved in cell wall biosynthesis
MPPERDISAWLSARATGIARRGSVFFHAPVDVFQAPGGGENQLVQTGRHLEERGVAVRLFNPWVDRLSEARLLHLFGMSREGLSLARAARRIGLPVVVSPICWFEPRALWSLESGVSRKLTSLVRWALRAWTGGRLPDWRRELLTLADAVLPNSQSEARQLERLFRVAPGRIQVVPNGVSAHFAEASPNLFRSRFGSDDFVLYVGRVEPRKNVLGLLRATRSLGLRLAVIGTSPPAFAEYERRCRREGGDDTQTLWIGHLEHDDPLLASAYAAARVFALPSWFETPGLSSLEAASAGTPVVTTPYGCTRDYFGDLVRYARPHDQMELERALEETWQEGANPRLSRLVVSRYLWPVAAQRTAEVYDAVAG